MRPALFDCNAVAVGPSRYHSHAAAAILCIVDSHAASGGLGPFVCDAAVVSPCLFDSDAAVFSHVGNNG